MVCPIENLIKYYYSNDCMNANKCIENLSQVLSDNKTISTAERIFNGEKIDRQNEKRIEINKIITKL